MTTEDQARSLAQSSRFASAGVRAAGLRLPLDMPKGQSEFNARVKQMLETGLGVRGTGFDGWVTRREMEERIAAFSAGGTVLNRGLPADGIAIPVTGKNGSGMLSIDEFAKSIMSTKLFRDLTASIDDANRFDDTPEQVRKILLSSIAEEAAQRGAAIRRSEEIIQNDLQSLAMTVEEVTASVAGASAGVRRVEYASASANRATAGIVTQVQARLDNFSGGAPGTATVESKMTAVADRATGLEAQYTLKVATNGAIAGFGVAATTSTAGVSTSHMLFLADHFAFITSSDVLGTGGDQINPTAPPASRVMFGIDANGAYLGGSLKVSGSATISGTTTATVAGVGSRTAALIVNQTLANDVGMWGFSSNASGAGVRGTSTGNNGSGVFGQALGAAGTQAAGCIGTATNSGNYGVIASGSAGAKGLLCVGDLELQGAMTITSTAVVTNLNAEQWAGIITTGTTIGSPPAATATLNASVGGTAFRFLIAIP